MRFTLDAKTLKRLSKSLISQPSVYDLAFWLAEKSKANNMVIIGLDNKNQLLRFSQFFKVVCVNPTIELETFPSNCQVIKKNLINQFPNIKKIFWENSVVVCINTVENLSKINHFLKNLSVISSYCKFLLITTPDKIPSMKKKLITIENPKTKKKWSLEEFNNLLNKYRFISPLIGRTIDNNINLQKNIILAIGGRHVDTSKKKAKLVLAFMQVYNEKDIICQTASYLLNQGIDVQVFDNWSDDGTYEILKKLAAKYKGLTVGRFPLDRPNNKYTLIDFFNHIASFLKTSNYDWFLYQGADEIPESPWPGINLKRGIEIVDALGFNAIDSTVVDFRPTVDGFKAGMSPETFFRYFSFGSHPAHFVQINWWKNQKDTPIDLAKTGGHIASFANQKVFPVKFLRKHYSFRSTSQAYIKLFKNRLARVDQEELKRGWHTHYQQYITNDELPDNFIWDKRDLLKYDKNSFSQNYLVERISGLGASKEYEKIKPYLERIMGLEEALKNIRSSKFFKLWQLYNKVFKN